MATYDSGNFKFTVPNQASHLQWPFPSQSSTGQAWNPAASQSAVDAQRSYDSRSSSSFLSADASFASSARGELPFQSPAVKPSCLTSATSISTFHPYGPAPSHAFPSSTAAAPVASERRPYAPTQPPPYSAPARGPHAGILRPSASSQAGMCVPGSFASAWNRGNGASYTPSTFQFPGEQASGPRPRPTASFEHLTSIPSEAAAGAFGSPVEASPGSRASTGAPAAPSLIPYSHRPYAPTPLEALPLEPLGAPAAAPAARHSRPNLPTPSQTWPPPPPTNPNPSSGYQPSGMLSRPLFFPSSQPPAGQQCVRPWAAAEAAANADRAIPGGYARQAPVDSNICVVIKRHPYAPLAPDGTAAPPIVVPVSRRPYAPTPTLPQSPTAGTGPPASPP